METYQAFVKAVFDSFKCMRKHEMLRCIPIYDDRNILAGYLRPITRDYRESLPGCAEQLALWHNANPSITSEQFTATEETTKDWLDHDIIGCGERIMFFIVLPGGRRVGHMGFSSFKYEARTCEIDGVLRGEKDALPGIMTFALHALVRWGLAALRLMNIELRVFSDNSDAIAYYKRSHFIIMEENLPVGGTKAKYYTRMRLDIAAWEAHETRGML